jgi:hypothetical protein
MPKKIIFVLAILSIFLPLSSKANWGWGAGAAIGFNNGFYNPALTAPCSGFNSLWGGGYNLNSMMGSGGWGGYPAGYGFGLEGFGGINNPGCGNGGALTGGFGGFYSPFVGGY